MPQRVVFPALPNIAEAQYLGVLQSLFAELSRAGGRMPFKSFREWAKERNLYNKEEFDDLMALLGCEVKPEVVLGQFGRAFMEASPPEAQQRLLYRWLFAWNPLLIKAVFEQLDIDAGGRLHSTHELYRYITSYAYPGSYVTLINFQNWVKWLAASGHIRYIGIRWGLGELGKKELQAVRGFDVDEFLEEEAADTEAGAAPSIGEGPGALAATAAPASPLPAGSPGASAAVEGGDDLPDMPPSPPPVTETASSTPPTVAAEPPPAGPRVFAAAGHAVVSSASAAWIPAAPGVEVVSARDLGFDATQYGEHPGAFLFGMAVAARLVTGGVPAAATRPFVTWLVAERWPYRLLAESRPLEELLEAAGWLRDQPALAAVFGWVAIDVLRVRRVLATHPSLSTRLEESRPADALVLVQDKLFGGVLSGAAFWLQREMVELELWDAG